jgi:hypothetical protein
MPEAHVQEEPDDLDADEVPQQPPPSRLARLIGGTLGALVGLLLGLAVSHTFDDWGRAGFCGLGMGLGVPVGVLVAYLFQARRGEPPPE